ncbi:hypothetical protein GQS_08950 [Thermococcus sp. 4557]|uniref:hypothetical protein n=1 Tax=Thermococcus sp. (strain CGMCC 1.5172 / 4557) TaxID=1042877 RepID=UPI000219EF14|nr:hypothetical protein [Thermococcus sp. 4557]AEK73684.1 hypothetical protein GQS_08950 [Thermococcus sp. 4557]
MGKRDNRTVIAATVATMFILFLAIGYMSIGPQEEVPGYPHNDSLRDSPSPIRGLNSFGNIMVLEHLPNGSVVRFTENVLAFPGPGNNSTASGKMYLINWTEGLGITPPCTIQGGAAILENNVTAEGFHDLSLCIANSSEIGLTYAGCLRKERASFKTELPPGRVSMATYAVPTSSATWDRWDHVYCGRVIDYQSVCGHPELWLKNLTSPCHNSLDEVLKALKGKIESRGFEEIGSERTGGQMFERVEVKLYRRDNEYLYVELAKVEEMDLVRVLMIMGDEKVVKAYAEAFTAVEGNGSGES